jgi:hypothetical protein
VDTWRHRARRLRRRTNGAGAGPLARDRARGGRSRSARLLPRAATSARPPTRRWRRRARCSTKTKGASSRSSRRRRPTAW